MYSYDYDLKSIYLYRYKTTQQYFLDEKRTQERNDLKTICKKDGVSAQQRKLHKTCSVPHTSNCYP